MLSRPWALWMLWLLAAGGAMRPIDALLAVEGLEDGAPTTPALQQYMHVWASLLHAQLAQLQRDRGGAPLRLAFLGDSTMRQQQRVLCTVLAQPPAPAAFNLSSIKDEERPEDDACAAPALNVSAVFMAAGCTLGRLAEGAQRLADAAQAPPAGGGPFDLLVFNMGLHFLHLRPARDFWCVGQTLNYTAELAAGVETLKQAVSPSGMLLFANAHSICDAKFRGPYAEWVKAWAAPTPQMVDECGAALAAHPAAAGRSRSKLDAVCASATFTDVGTRWLNQQAARVMRDERRGGGALLEQGGGPGSRHGAAGGLQVGVLDSHALTRGQCWASGVTDGRHYLPLVPLQLQALLGRAQQHWGHRPSG